MQREGGRKGREREKGEREAREGRGRGKGEREVSEGGVEADYSCISFGPYFLSYTGRIAE